MKPRFQITLLATLLICGTVLGILLYVERPGSPMKSTLSSSFQLFGTPVKFLDRAVSRVIPVSALDENELGSVFHKRYETQIAAGSADQAYLDAIMSELKSFTNKPFLYRAYVIGYYGAPNAMALPGGVILVTKELLETLHSESELIAVLAHEIGHIERGHCFDVVRFQLLSRKIGSDMLGKLADATIQILTRHAYSKTTEHEADEYSYELLVNSKYDPFGVGKSFASLQKYAKNMGVQTPDHANLIRDYFMSHPPLEIREVEFRERATAWCERHQNERRYVGRQSFLKRNTLNESGADGDAEFKTCRNSNENENFRK